MAKWCEFLWFGVNLIWLLAWLIVCPYDNFPFFLCGRPTCPMQYCPLFPGCCKKGDASQKPEIRLTTLLPAPDATREQIASHQKYLSLRYRTQFLHRSLKDEEEQYNNTNLARAIHTAGWWTLRTHHKDKCPRVIHHGLHQWGYDTCKIFLWQKLGSECIWILLLLQKHTRALHNHMFIQKQKGYQNPSQIFIHGNEERKRMLGLVNMKLIHCPSSLHSRKDM